MLLTNGLEAHIALPVEPGLPVSRVHLQDRLELAVATIDAAFYEGHSEAPGGERLLTFSFFQAPQFHRILIRTRCQQRAIRRERHRIDWTSMFHGETLSACRYFPHPDLASEVACGEPFPVSGESDGSNAVVLTGNCLGPTRSQVPQFYAAPIPGSDLLSIGRIRHGRNNRETVKKAC